MMKRLFTKIAIAAAAIGLSGGAALAASVVSQFFPGELNKLSDNSAEYLINGDGGTDTILAVGDRLRGMFDVNTVEDLTGGGGTNSLGLSSGNNEFSGFFDFEVAAIIDTGVPGTSRYTFIFKPYAGFATEVETLAGLNAGDAAGAMLALYEDVTEFDRLGNAGTQETLIDNVTDGTLRMILGFGADGAPNTVFGGFATGATGDEAWYAQSSTNDIGVVANIPSPTNGGTVNFSVSVLQNYFPGVFFGAVSSGPSAIGVVDAPSDFLVTGFNGAANLLGIGGASTPFDIFDDLNATFRPNVVPEPATMLLLGSGLLGIAGLSRRKKKG